MATVHIPPQLVRFTDGAREVEVSGTTLREIIERLDERFPGLRDCLLEEDRMRPGMNAAVDSVVHPTGLRTPVGPQSEVHFIPAISGGSEGDAGESDLSAHDREGHPGGSEARTDESLFLRASVSTW